MDKGTFDPFDPRNIADRTIARLTAERDEARQRAERAEAIVEQVRDLRARMWKSWLEACAAVGVSDPYGKAPWLLKELGEITSETAIALKAALAADQPAEAGGEAAVG